MSLTAKILIVSISVGLVCALPYIGLLWAYCQGRATYRQWFWLLIGLYALLSSGFSFIETHSLLAVAIAMGAYVMTGAYLYALRRHTDILLIWFAVFTVMVLTIGLMMAHGASHQL